MCYALAGVDGQKIWILIFPKVTIVWVANLEVEIGIKSLIMSVVFLQGYRNWDYPEKWYTQPVPNNEMSTPKGWEYSCIFGIILEIISDCSDQLMRLCRQWLTDSRGVQQAVIKTWRNDVKYFHYKVTFL